MSGSSPKRALPFCGPSPHTEGEREREREREVLLTITRGGGGSGGGGNEDEWFLTDGGSFLSAALMSMGCVAMGHT
jgi:hypothetical protein